MHPPRATPFDLAFGETAPVHFPSLRAALTRSQQDPRDRDAFFMLREAVTLMRDLRPDEGLGQGIDQLAALIHQGYLFWNAGAPVLHLSREDLTKLLASGAPPVVDRLEPSPYYAQLPLGRVWAEVIPGQPVEPLDGCFVHLTQDPAVLSVLGVFGVHSERPGFSAVEVSGPRPAVLVRPDGSPLFSSVLPGGATAGLYSLVGEEELLELGWRTLQFASAPIEASAWRA